MTSSEAGAAIVAVRGEVDADNCGQLAAALDAIEVDGDRLIFDARELSFIDSSGISELLRTRSALEAKGVRFEIREPTSQVRRVLEITGLVELFHID